MDLAARKKKELRENPVGRGRGMVRRADKYLAQQHGKEPSWASGPVTAPPMFPDRTAMPDDYLSAQEPSEFEYDSEETDPGEPEDCCDIGQIDRFSIIELNPSFVLSSDNTNCKNDIQLFLQLFDELSVYRDYH